MIYRIAYELLLIILIILVLNVPIKSEDPYTVAWTSLSGTSVQTGEESHSIVIDNAGYIYTTGKVYDSMDGQTYIPYSNSNKVTGDIFLIKYQPDGTKVWTKMYGTSEAEWPRGIAIDRYYTTYIIYL